jgi:hypothetical protein
MNAFMRFAKAMSEQLFEMRGEDLMNETLYHEDQYGDNQVISQEYIDTVLYDPAHSEAIKERIRLAVLADVQQHPDDYDMCGDDYVYSGNIYTHAYVLDHYIQEQYPKDHPEFHTVFQCSNCGSDNVQVKAWVRPNEGAKLVDYLTDQVTDGFCDDCQQHVITDTVEMNVREKVIGFQVVSLINPDLIHPAMTNRNCVYDISVADDMIRTHRDWQLKTIWSQDIANPVMMFEGDPRNPTQKSKQ